VTGSGWKQCTMGEVATFQRGFDLPATIRQPGNVPVISSAGITGYHNEHKVKGPGVVTGRYGSIGEVFYIEKNFWPLNTALWVNDFHGNDPEFVALLAGTLDLTKLSGKTGVPGVNRNDIHELSVSIPRLAEQKEFVAIVRKWKDAIRLTEHKIACMRRYQKTVVQQLLTGKQRFTRFVKSTATNKTRWLDVPCDWQYPPLAELAASRSKRNRDKQDLPVLSCTKHRGLVDSLEYFGKQVFSKDLSAYKVVEVNQFAYATNHIEEGSIGYQSQYDAAIVSPMYTVFETNDRISDGYLLLLLKTELYRHIFEVNTSKSVDRRGSLRWDTFSRIHVPLPSLAEQQAIVRLSHVFEQEMSLLQQQLQAYRAQKKGLVTQLLGGKVRLDRSCPPGRKAG